MDIFGRFYPRLSGETYVKADDLWNQRWDKFLEIAGRTNDNRPVLATEYAHAMGNAVGNLQEYWDEIYSHPRMLGGFIWEWCDQGLHKTLPDGKTFTAFGGDFGDVPNHGGFAIKGLVNAEREIFPKYWEVKKVYQPVAIEPVHLKPDKVAVKISNRNSFFNLGKYEARWSVTGDGVVLQSGQLNPVECPPGKSVAVKIPVKKIEQPAPGVEFWLRVSLHTRTDTAWAKAGHEIAWQQMQLTVPTPAIPKFKTSDLSALKLFEAGDVVNIEGTNFSVSFRRSAGTLISLNFAGRDMLAQTTNGLAGPVLQMFRAPTDNDKGFGNWLARDWREAGLTNLIRQVVAFEVSQPKSGEVKISTTATSSAATGGFKLHTTWKVHGDGSVDMDNHFEPFGELPWLPRIGVVMSVAGEFQSFRWCGRGPFENYSDRKQSADIGIWSGTVAGQFVPYVRPQENGNKEDVRWATLTDADGKGLLVVAEENPIAVSALPFTAADLISVRHNFGLKPRSETILSLDARQSGLGNSSCGPGVLERYAVPPQPYHLHLRFLPCPAGTDAAIAALARRP